MTEDERFRLLFGPYRTPRFEYGDVVVCERIGEAVITGLTEARIPWPIGKRVGKRERSRSILLYGPLVDAVRRESAQAVAHWWGVCLETVWRWKTALGVEANTEGTRQLRHEYAFEPGALAGLEKSHDQSRDEDEDRTRREKIAAAKRGQPRPRHVIEAMRKGRTGKPHTEEARRRMSEAQRRRGARPPKAGRPWTPEEDELVRTLPATEVARRTARSLQAVYTRRGDLKVPDGRTRAARGREELVASM